ncbi:hypothetical protein BCF44_11727 [Kutzneria buriramensis]|uniref:Uncharacterized protein n=1 Tax=Kutzneria buriramensis TaxID=1045776 RepID=A0A3E0H0Q7_9PSEU|nr:hypothetical protein BCF44_11727 [Kutzneria buriramensis]
MQDGVLHQCGDDQTRVVGHVVDPPAPRQVRRRSVGRRLSSGRPPAAPAARAGGTRALDRLRKQRSGGHIASIALARSSSRERPSAPLGRPGGRPSQPRCRRRRRETSTPTGVTTVVWPRWTTMPNGSSTTHLTSALRTVVTSVRPSPPTNRTTTACGHVEDVLYAIDAHVPPRGRVMRTGQPMAHRRLIEYLPDRLIQRCDTNEGDSPPDTRVDAQLPRQVSTAVLRRRYRREQCRQVGERDLPIAAGHPPPCISHGHHALNDVRKLSLACGTALP